MSEIVSEKKLTGQQRTAIEALLTTGTQTAAAAAAGVNRRTIRRWLDQPEFKDALRTAESEAIASLSRSLNALGEMAVQTLRDAMSADEKMAHRLRATEIMLSNLLRIQEFYNIDMRLSELESDEHGV